MISRVFSKPALTIAQQIAHLRACNMTVEDDGQAEYWLTNVSYYRLSGYWYPQKDRHAHETRFVDGTSFRQVTELYDFDRRLRRIVGHGAEHVEVALRGSWAYAMALQGGSHGYLDAALYRDREQFHDNFAKSIREAGGSSETYIRHYRETYDNPASPAVWMVAEMMTFGQLSRWYSLLSDPVLRDTIARPFGLGEDILVPAIKHLNDVRNVAAHHGRLWNRRFRNQPRLPRRPVDLGATVDRTVASAPGTVYNALVILNYLLRQVVPMSSWRSDLLVLLTSCSMNMLDGMGFPPDWATRPLWR